MIERINDFMARRFGVGKSVASFVRIHVWVLVFLVVLSLVLPSHALYLQGHVSATTRTADLGLPYSDTRGYAPSPYKKGRFHIAWIAGSEAHLLDAAGNSEFLPNLALAHLPPRINGRKIAVDFYFLDAMRLGDIYFSLLDALQTKPDMIVIDLNTAWVLNPLATHQWTQLDARAAVQLLTKPSAWPLAASWLSPSDLLWGLADAHLDEFRDRSYYSDQIHKQVDTLGPLDLSQLSTVLNSQVPTRTDEVLGMLPVNFWAQYRLHKPRTSTADRWADWLGFSNDGKNGLNKTILRLMADALRSSKIPSLLYLSPVNSDWYATVPRLKDAVSGIEDQLEKLRPEFDAPNIRLQPLTASRFVPPLQFVQDDLIHLTHADPMGPYLAGQICDLVRQVKDRAVCTPSNERSR